MNITEAARATRKWRSDYFDHSLYAMGESAIRVSRESDLQAACDRMNLLAVLRGHLREPSERMIDAGFDAGLSANSETGDIWRSMIDAAIKEIEGHD